jgi:hypothetical protein
MKALAFLLRETNCILAGVAIGCKSNFCFFFSFFPSWKRGTEYCTLCQVRLYKPENGSCVLMYH